MREVVDCSNLVKLYGFSCKIHTPKLVVGSPKLSHSGVFSALSYFSEHFYPVLYS